MKRLTVSGITHHASGNQSEKPLAGKDSFHLSTQRRAERQSGFERRKETFLCIGEGMLGTIHSTKDRVFAAETPHCKGYAGQAAQRHH
jgi:hypothetical protein